MEILLVSQNHYLRSNFYQASIASHALDGSIFKFLGSFPTGFRLGSLSLCRSSFNQLLVLFLNRDDPCPCTEDYIALVGARSLRKNFNKVVGNPVRLSDWENNILHSHFVKYQGRNMFFGAF